MIISTINKLNILVNYELSENTGKKLLTFALTKPTEASCGVGCTISAELKVLTEILKKNTGAGKSEIILFKVLVMELRKGSDLPMATYVLCWVRKHTVSHIRR